jgi:amino acid transporter
MASRDADVHDLHRLGYAQLLLRDMGGFGSFAMSFSIISVITGAAGTFGYAVTHGGPFGVLAGWALASIFALAMGASMAEIASSIPTAGAMYHWATYIGNRAWGWFTAWMVLVGQYAITAGTEYGTAQFVAPLLGVDGTRAHLLWLTALLLLMHGLFAHFGIRLCVILNNISAIYNMVLILGIAGGVLLLPHAPWGELLSTQHAPSNLPYGALFMLGLLPAMWIYTGYDASAHISEETRLPRVNAAWGIYNAIAISAVFGFLLLLALDLGIRDVSQVPVDSAMLYTLTQSFGPRGGTMVAWGVAGAMWFCCLACVVSAGRAVYGFARDRGMPGWMLWSRVSARWRTPALATWNAVVVGMLLVILVTAKTADLSVFVAMAVIAIYVGYGLPVALRLWARHRGTWRDDFDGPWSLGRCSTPINLAAVVWVIFSCVLFSLPPNTLAGELFVGVLVVLLIAWFGLGERERFRGPRSLGTEEQLAALEAQVEKESYWTS